jgi:hypothetical protein
MAPLVVWLAGDGVTVKGYLDLATALFALAAAVFWFLASRKLPPIVTYWDATPVLGPISDSRRALGAAQLDRRTLERAFRSLCVPELLGPMTGGRAGQALVAAAGGLRNAG